MTKWRIKGKGETLRRNDMRSGGRGVNGNRFCIGLVVSRIGGSTILLYSQQNNVTLGS